MSKLLVKIENASAFIPGDAARRLVLRNVSWNIADHAGIVGANGAGKSTLLRLAHGDLRPCAGSIVWLDNDGWTASAIAARELGALVSPHIQAQCQRHAWDVTGMQMLAGAANDAPLAFAEKPDARAEQVITTLLAKMEALPLLRMRLPQLSQGQLRLLLLARALLAKPKLLLLDEWADGLDARKRLLLAEVLAKYADTMLMVFTGHREDTIPAWVKTRLYMQQGKLLREPPTREPEQKFFCTAEIDMICGVCVDKQTPNEQLPGRNHYASCNVDTAGTTDRTSATNGQGASVYNEMPLSSKSAERDCNQILINLQNVSVYIEGELILHEVSWALKKGEHWHIAGANGSGKSTFLRLLAGDEFGAAGGSIKVYSARTSKEIRTLAQKRRTVSLVSDLGQALYGYPLTGRELVLSGCDMSVGNYREYSEAEERRADDLLKMFFGDADWPQIAGASIRQLSTGQLRRLFLTRALMPAPEVLLLDEPCSGLDVQSRLAYLDLLANLARWENGPQIVLASHYVEDIPKFVNRMARMDAGRLAVEE